jgi:hypothetical protein
MLSPLDDLPVHQVTETMATVGTTDRHFYDRYYFNLHNRSDELFLAVGHGQYPNLGTTDAFLAVACDGTQHVVRASRELGVDRLDTRVGPIDIEVEEGLERLRVVCDAAEHGIEADLRWQGAIPAHEEPRHRNQAPHGRVVMDTMRFAQTGRWSGSLRIDGREFEVTPDTWWGNRDRSWGTRPVGEPEPPGIGGAIRGFFWQYAVPQFEDGTTILYLVQEEPDGQRVMERAVRLRPDGVSEDLGRPHHELEFVPGTRTWRRAEVRFAGGLTMTAESLRPLHISRGTGYGFDEDWRHGMYQGPEPVTQHVTFDISDPEAVQPIPGAIVDHAARFTTSEGDEGYGLFEIMTLGPHERYFEGWD